MNLAKERVLALVDLARGWGEEVGVAGDEEEEEEEVEGTEDIWKSWTFAMASLPNVWTSIVSRVTSSSQHLQQYHTLHVLVSPRLTINTTHSQG